MIRNAAKPLGVSVNRDAGEFVGARNDCGRALTAKCQSIEMPANSSAVWDEQTTENAVPVSVNRDAGEFVGANPRGVQGPRVSCQSIEMPANSSAAPIQTAVNDAVACQSIEMPANSSAQGTQRGEPCSEVSVNRDAGEFVGD